jgi:hypothetical protein
LTIWLLFLFLHIAGSFCFNAQIIWDWSPLFQTLTEYGTSSYKFEKKFWRVLKTTNPIERVNKELKRRTKSMETVGEKTLTILLAFTAMRLEYNWQKLPVDSEVINNLKPISKRNQIDEVLEKLIH